MRLTIEITPDDLMDLRRDTRAHGLDSEEFIRREIFGKGMEQNESNLAEAGLLSEIFDGAEGDMEGDPDLFGDTEEE